MAPSVKSKPKATEREQKINIHGLTDLLEGDSNAISEVLQKHKHKIFPPNAQKSLRRFTSNEVAKILGIYDGYLRTLHSEGKGPNPEVSSNGRRSYSYENIWELRQLLDQNGKADRFYIPERRPGDHLQIISVANFKGGSAKTTSAIHLAQHLALQGHRVLAIDLDPQASLTAMFAYDPEFDIGPDETLFGAIKFTGEPRPIRDVIRKTYFPRLDLIPGNIELMEYEHESPVALANRTTSSKLFFLRVAQALAEIESDYDVVVIDCPPQLGYLTLSALCASTSVLITVNPQMLDVMSMAQFLTMTVTMMRTVAKINSNIEYDWLRYLITRFEPTDGPQVQMVALMRATFGERVLVNSMLKSTAISDASITKQTLYEVPREQFTRGTYDRAFEALSLVNSEIESLIHKAWGR
jgi:chromosome partitioning protein